MCTHSLIAHGKRYLPCACAWYDGSQKCYYSCARTGHSA